MKKNTIEFVIPLRPVTKKNSQRIIQAHGHPMIIPSQAYKDWERDSGYYMKPKPDVPIDYPVTVKCIFYMPTKRRVDLCNLLEAACDCLVYHKVLSDDNSNIVFSHDGSRVAYDKENPRTEIFIERGFDDDIQET